MMMLSDDAVDILRLAIVKQAVKDYITAYKKVKRLERKSRKDEQFLRDLADARAKLGKEKSFFYSEWYHLLMNIEPDTLIRLMEGMADKKQEFI